MDRTPPPDFGPAVDRWAARLGSVRDVVRQELVASQLAAHLPPPDEAPLRVLDVGCGQGTQAIRLAARGHSVTGLDTAPGLLERARVDAVAQLGEDANRLTLVHGDLFDFATARPGTWDVVCCHGVVMYLPSLSEAVVALVSLTAVDGLLSLLTRNQAGLAMRAGLAGRWRDASASFDSDHYTNNLGLSGVRADRPEAVQAALSAAGADPLAWYGVRLFSDHLADQPADVDVAALVHAELEAGRRDPYRAVAALTHTLARRRA